MCLCIAYNKITESHAKKQMQKINLLEFEQKRNKKIFISLQKVKSNSSPNNYTLFSKNLARELTKSGTIYQSLLGDDS